MMSARFVVREKSAACATLAMALLLCSQTFAATFHVDSNADDGSPGTLEWALLQCGFDPLGDSILIDPMVITLARELPSLSGKIEIIGAGRDSTTIQAAATPFNSATNRRVFHVSPTAQARITDLTVQNGDLSVDDDSKGGGINNAGELVLERVHVKANRSSRGAKGGGIFNSGSIIIRECEISENRVRGLSSSASTAQKHASGAGIYNSASMLICDSWIHDNSGTSAPGSLDDTAGVANGGGISLGAAATSLIERCTVSENTLTGGVLGSANVSGYGSCAGGGIYAESDSPEATIIRLSTISGNRIEYGGLGGGILASYGTVVDSCTIANNSIGGSLTVGPSVLTRGANLYAPFNFGTGECASLHNTILAGGWVGGGPRVPDDASGRVKSLGYNFFQVQPQESDVPVIDVISAGTTSLGNLIGINPAILPLADNGGPTPTHELGPTSFARDRGVSTDVNGVEFLTDQRGFIRRRGVASDMGAVESGEPSSVSTFDLYE
jgi:hypothetical protein